MSELEIIKRPASSNSEDGQQQNYKKAGQAVKKAAWMAFGESMLLVILGIFLLIWPTTVIKVIAYALGGFLAIKGCYRVLNYFMTNGQKDYFNMELFWGIISTVVGLTLVILGEGIAGAFRIVVGIWIIYESLLRINTTTKLNAAGAPAWRYTLLVSLIMLALGLFVTFTDGAITQLVGAMMIVSGIVGVVGDVMFMQYVGLIVQKLTGASAGKKAEEKTEEETKE